MSNDVFKNNLKEINFKDVGNIKIKQERKEA